MPYKDREKRRQYDRERRRRLRNGAIRKTASKDRPGKSNDPSDAGSDRISANPTSQPEDDTVRTIDDVRNVLSRQVAAVEAAEVDEIVRARTLAYIANVLIRTLEIGEIEKRLEALEAAAADGPEQGAGGRNCRKEVATC